MSTYLQSKIMHSEQRVLAACCVCAYVYACMYACIACMYCMYVCMCVCMYVYQHTCRPRSCTTSRDSCRMLPSRNIKNIPVGIKKHAQCHQGVPNAGMLQAIRHHKMATPRPKSMIISLVRISGEGFVTCSSRIPSPRCSVAVIRSLRLTIVLRGFVGGENFLDEGCCVFRLRSQGSDNFIYHVSYFHEILFFHEFPDRNMPSCGEEWSSENKTGSEWFSLLFAQSVGLSSGVRPSHQNLCITVSEMGRPIEIPRSSYSFFFGVEDVPIALYMISKNMQITNDLRRSFLDLVDAGQVRYNP
jgi:hypothetical protein